MSQKLIKYLKWKIESLNSDSQRENTKKKKMLIVYTFNKRIIELGDILRVHLSCFPQCNKIVSKSFIIEIGG